MWRGPSLVSVAVLSVCRDDEDEVVEDFEELHHDHERDALIPEAKRTEYGISAILGVVSAI